ncbi:MAG: hypothetical protein IT385_26570 [Deltaproteobacteria bacterium]|nr:hypothetical protein [Deltaproteobacteria bacterium]
MNDEELVERTLAEIDRAHDARRDGHVRAALSEVAGRGARRWSLRPRVAVLAALAIAATAALVTWGVMRATAPEEPLAFGQSVAEPGGGWIARDARGRVSEIQSAPPRADGRPDGERLLFRAGRLARVERWRDGVQHGVAVDFDARGFVSAIRHWDDGREAGPWIELDADGRVRASGVR